jgi:hypothetical protein
VESNKKVCVVSWTFAGGQILITNDYDLSQLIIFAYLEEKKQSGTMRQGCEVMDGYL